MTFQLRPHQELALNAQKQNDRGVICFPTGAGKTAVGITDIIDRFDGNSTKTVVIVAPRLLLSKQLANEYLEHINDVRVLCVHSGKNRHFKTTKVDVIQEWHQIHKDHNKLIFTTYHSLKKIKASMIPVDTYIFDEAHNSIRSDFFEEVEKTKDEKTRAFFYTATPKHSDSYDVPGMNDVEVYGNTISSVAADYLVDEGFILQPELTTKTYEDDENIPERDNLILTDIVDTESIDKLMVCAKSTRNIINLFNETDFIEQMNARDYSVMSITSMHGAFIDGETMEKDKFFQTLNEWGKDEDKKFILFQYSMIGEGINISCLEGVILMRLMKVSAVLQNIGRCIRLHPKDAEGMSNGTIIPGNSSTYTKPVGRVIVPVFNKTMERVAASVDNIINLTFNEGETLVEEVGKPKKKSN
jgi:superfamily II DNA or RNA helicase